MESGDDCLACDLLSGAVELPGGIIWRSDAWVIEHCVGPLGIGTLILKTARHCTSLAELEPAEAFELGPLIRAATACVRDLSGADQVYCCLWSHAGWKPAHLHFVVQPASAAQANLSEKPGPFLQVEMFRARVNLDGAEVREFCGRARTHFEHHPPLR
jgi:diadenosine tetraphosphate (Ap4A) HIT family hydrolase